MAFIIAKVPSFMRVISSSDSKLSSNGSYSIFILAKQPPSLVELRVISAPKDFNLRPTRPPSMTEYLNIWFLWSITSIRSLTSPNCSLAAHDHVEKKKNIRVSIIKILSLHDWHNKAFIM